MYAGSVNEKQNASGWFTNRYQEHLPEQQKHIQAPGKVLIA